MVVLIQTVWFCRSMFIAVLLFVIGFRQFVAPLHGGLEAIGAPRVIHADARDVAEAEAGRAHALFQVVHLVLPPGDGPVDAALRPAFLPEAFE